MSAGPTMWSATTLRLGGAAMLALSACIEENPNWIGGTTTDASTTTTSTSGAGTESTTTGPDSTDSGNSDGGGSTAVDPTGSVSSDTTTGGCEPDCDPILEVCEDGECRCRDGLTACDGKCAPVKNDPMHCGSCTMSCLSAFCGGGECNTPSCVGFPDICGGACTDVMIDPLHCGACDSPCLGDELCLMGSCVPYTLPGCFECPCPDCGALNCCNSDYLERPVCVDASC